MQYQFWLYNPNAIPAWSQLQGYSASATCTWTPAAPGNYLLSTTAQDGATGTIVNNMLWYTIGNPLTAVTVTSSPVSPQPPNTPITLTATATGGTNVQYQFWLYNMKATPAWSQLQGYSASATCVWTPTAPGTYLLSITAQDCVAGTAVNTLIWYTIGNPLTAVSVSRLPLRRNSQARQSPSLRRRRAGPMCSTSSGFITRTPIRHGANCKRIPPRPPASGHPTATGNYLISVTAQDGSTGTVVNTTFWYTIADLLLSVTATPPSPQQANTPITFTATATGGTNVQYQFWLYNPNDNPAWKQLQAYSTSATCAWTPAATGSYLLSVTALDGATGAAVNTMLWYTVQ